MKDTYRRKRWWGAGGVLLLIVIIGSVSVNHHGTPKPAGTGATRSSPSTTAGATATSEEDDLGGTGAPTIRGPAVVLGSGGVTGPPACRSGSPVANVYHPNRLSVVKTCITVSGTVESVRSESDGDTHFDLEPDPSFSNLLKSANYAHQHGWLVAEIVPADEPGCTPGRPPRPASGTYDYGTCTGADEIAPMVGQHVSVTGPYVLDEDHGGWAEIHPVWGVSTQDRSPGVVAAPATTQGPTPTTGQPGASSPPANTSGPGLRILSVTSPVRRGATVTLTAQTAPHNSCDLQVTLPSGAQSQSEGLGPATADADGSVHWTWRTGSRTTPGTATAAVTCGSSSASAEFDITS
ncbi:MAG TPA: hypothetical protein VFH70_02350 [Acidimicrobiales bacterium]|nr:hypothetical protein [Acidimicrobiales bacterium]